MVLRQISVLPSRSGRWNPWACGHQKRVTLCRWFENFSCAGWYCLKLAGDSCVSNSTTKLCHGMRHACLRVRKVCWHCQTVMVKLEPEPTFVKLEAPQVLIVWRSLQLHSRQISSRKIWDSPSDSGHVFFLLREKIIEFPNQLPRIAKVGSWWIQPVLFPSQQLDWWSNRTSLVVPLLQLFKPGICHSVPEPKQPDVFFGEGKVIKPFVFPWVFEGIWYTYIFPKWTKTAPCFKVLGKHASGELFLRPSLASLLKGQGWAEFGHRNPADTCRIESDPKPREVELVLTKLVGHKNSLTRNKKLWFHQKPLQRYYSGHSQDLKRSVASFDIWLTSQKCAKRDPHMCSHIWIRIQKSSKLVLLGCFVFA